jgi:hypothetical protein
MPKSGSFNHRESNSEIYIVYGVRIFYNLYKVIQERVISIYELEDEWYLVRESFVQTIEGTGLSMAIEMDNHRKEIKTNFYKCDQVEGLFKLFENIFNEGLKTR